MSDLAFTPLAHYNRGIDALAYGDRATAQGDALVANGHYLEGIGHFLAGLLKLNL